MTKSLLTHSVPTIRFVFFVGVAPFKGSCHSEARNFWIHLNIKQNIARCNVFVDYFTLENLSRQSSPSAIPSMMRTLFSQSTELFLIGSGAKFNESGEWFFYLRTRTTSIIIKLVVQDLIDYTEQKIVSKRFAKEQTENQQI